MKDYSDYYVRKLEFLKNGHEAFGKFNPEEHDGIMALFNWYCYAIRILEGLPDDCFASPNEREQLLSEFRKRHWFLLCLTGSIE